MRVVYELNSSDGNLVGYELGYIVGADIVECIKTHGFIHVLVPVTGVRISATFALGVIDRLREYIGIGEDLYKHVEFVGDIRLTRVFEEAYDYSIWSRD